RLRHPSRPSPALAGTRSRPCGDDEGAGDHGGRSIRGRGMSDPGHGRERRRTAMSEKKESLSAAERAYRAIRSQSHSGVHDPGTMVGESARAAEIGASRTPVRVALARLQDEGWILIYPKRGAIVQGIDERTIVELAAARYALETTAVDRAPDQLRRRLAERLEESIDQPRAALAERDLAPFIDLTLAFPRAFLGAGDTRAML